MCNQLSVSVLSERFISDHGLGEKLKAKTAKNERLHQNAYQFVLCLFDWNIQTNSAKFVTGRGICFFRPELFYAGDGCYNIKKIALHVDKLKDHALVMSAENEDAMT